MSSKTPWRASVLMRLCALGAGLLLQVSDVGATGWKPNVRAGSDIVMMDQRWPVWDQGTYYCFWYMFFVPKEAYGGVFYGGIATGGADSPPGMFMSHWGNPTVLHVGEYFYPHGYGAEGASGGAHGKALFMRTNAWYRFVMRMYPPTEDKDGKTCIGWWVKDLEKNRWYTHSIVSLPTHLTGFAGNSGFVEALAPESVHRAFEWRLGYCRADGQWHKANEVGSRSLSQFKLIENGTALRFDRPVENDRGGAKSDVIYATSAPDAPPLDAPAIGEAGATRCENQASVTWNIPPHAAPQLGYKIEVFGATGAQGRPFQVVEDRVPYRSARCLDTGQAAQSVRLTVTDIFDQQASVVIPVREATLLPAAEAAGARPGLAYAYYEAPANTEWEQLPDFQALTPVRQGHVKTLDDTVQGDREKRLALRYRGWLRAPADGLYVFAVGTCDGSRLSLDGKTMADNDGLHSMSVRQYPIALKKGTHTFELLYFKGAGTRHGGHANLADKLSVSWEGPGFGLRKLAENDFLCEGAELPALTLSLKDAARGGVIEDNLVEILATPSPGGHRLAKVQLYSGRMLLESAEGAALQKAGPVAFKILFPAGRNRIWARLWYDGQRSVDADNALEFETREHIKGPWTFTVLGHKYPIAARYKDGTASFTGEGTCVGTQKVVGDFTLTARIADITLTTEENGVNEANWLGLYTSSVKPSRNKNDRSLEASLSEHGGFSIFLTAGKGMKGTADFPDLGGGRMCMPSFPKGHRWLRIVRRGQRYESFTSADGRTWQKAMEIISRNHTDEQYAGIQFRAVPGKGRGLFQGALDSITLERNKVPTEVRGKPRAQDLRLEHRVTALVQAPKAPDVLYARSPIEGVLKSTDRGETWQPANTGLDSSDARAVRSLAVHPGNPAIVLRAGGCVVGGRLQSGLWRSADAGKSWKLVTREIDFDGRGPTAIFGEVVSFCAEDPNLVAAGGEAKGVFLSRDAGETWEHAGLAGARVTCLQFNPKTTTLIVGTFADSEFETLGLGKPAAPVKAAGGIYHGDFKNGKLGLKPVCELDDFGVVNIGGGEHPNFSTLATTRGVYYTWQRGNAFSQRRYNVPADTLVTALGYRRFVKEVQPTDFRTVCTTYAAPFSSEASSPVYCVPERTTVTWSILAHDARVLGQAKDLALNAGVTCILPDTDQEHTLYLCNRDGVFKSIDKGKSYRRVLSNQP
ncbi:MAG: PA14 domain-containing protein [Kiritimatiellaeota bacterium]|nr:PA14 domain-containing protein [Kiritimatiellota bacterium]